MDWIIGLLTLAALEIVLGIDNIVFVGILSDRVKEEDRPKARRLGLIGALVTRIILLTTLSWLSGLTAPLITLFGFAVTIKGLVLLGGGLFLLVKSTKELHHQVENGHHQEHALASSSSPLWRVVGTIMVMDIVFSLDSVITAVGMVNNIPVMIAAIVIAMVVMITTVNMLSDFVSRHPTIKVLALSFLLLIGFTLILAGTGMEVSKGYIYFAMGFSVLVEMLNMRMHNKTPVIK